MHIGNIIVILVLVMYSRYFILLLDFSQREEIKATNTRLEELRKVSVKTVEQQKEFIELRYPRKMIKFTLDGTILFVLHIILIVYLFKVYNYIFYMFNIDIRIWQATVFLILFPVIINVILKKIGLQKKGVRIL